jgi:general secretion pathway protein A
VAAAGALVAVLALAALWPEQEAPLPTATAGATTAAATAADAAPAAAVPTAQAVRRLDADALARMLATAPASPQPAWQRLLELWKQPSSAITVDADGGCTAAAAGVHCSGGRAPLDRLLALDRPVVLRLRNGTAPAWAVLVGADARSARLSLDDGVADVERGLLQSVWDGGYTALWQGPAALGTPMAPGSRGPAVDWLRVRLALPAGDGASYDAAATEAVRDFQRARGLPVDGVAGPETLIALAGDETGPHLKRELGEDR